MQENSYYDRAVKFIYTQIIITLICTILFSCNIEKNFIRTENFQKGEPQKFISYANSGLYEIIFLYPNHLYLYYKRDLLIQKTEGI